MNQQQRTQMSSGPGGGLPRIVPGSETQPTSSQGARVRRPKQGVNSMAIEPGMIHSSGSFAVNQRGSLQMTGIHAHQEVQLNQNLKNGRQKMTSETKGMVIQMGQTFGPDVRPATTKYNMARTIVAHDMMEHNEMLPNVGGQGHPRNLKKHVFQTAGEGSGMRRDGSAARFSHEKAHTLQNQQLPSGTLPSGQKRRFMPGSRPQLNQNLDSQQQAKMHQTKTGATPKVTQGSASMMNGGQSLGSRFRVAVPMQYQNTQKSNVAQKRIASNSFWNQVSKNMNSSGKASQSGAARLKDKGEHAAQQNQCWQQDKPEQSSELADPTRDSEIASTEMQKRIKLYQDTLTGKLKDSNQQTKPYSFLTNIGGKDTTQQGLALRTGLGITHGPQLSAASALLISQGKVNRASLPTEELSDKESQQLAIFTDMNVDKLNQNSKTMPRQRVVYLNSSTSNKNLGPNQRLAQSKSGVTLEPLTNKNVVSNKQLMPNPSFESIARRPISGISKDGSQSRFRQSQQQFQVANMGEARGPETGHLSVSQHPGGQTHQSSIRHDVSAHGGNAGQNMLHSVRGLLHDEYSEEAYLIDEVDDEQDMTGEQADPNQMSQFCQQLMEARPTTTLVGSQEPEDQLPYPELFDRSERTFAATFAKYGDLSYFTPVQRIGTYMEYQARLKKRHLMDLIAYIKTSQCQIKLDDAENDNSGGVQSAQDFLDHCLFHGLMSQQESIALTEASEQQPERQQPDNEIPTITYAQHGVMQNQLVLNDEENQAKSKALQAYNPTSAKARFGFDFGKIWSDKLLKQVQISIYRMLHYIENSDSIRNKELSNYKKEWMKNALDRVPDYLLSQYPVEVKLLFHDVFQNYIRSMKTAIMEYILRSPDERKRLHILTLPHQVLTAAQRQAQYGGYSIVDYQGTHNRKTHAETEIKFRLITYNIVVSQLASWWQEFRKLKLCDLSNLRQVVKERDAERENQDVAQSLPTVPISPSMSLDIDNFFGFQEAMLEKTVALMKHIWHRGSILIVKKFKILQTKQQKKELVTGNAARSKWTYAGFQTYPTDLGFPIMSESYQKLEKTLDDVRDFIYSGGSEEDSQMNQYQEYCMRTACAHQNVLHRFFRVEPAHRHDAVIDEYLESSTLDDLMDIRESDAYIAFVQMVGGFTNYEENGYDILSKEYKRELKYAAGNLMRIQLRQMVDESVCTFTNFFKGFKTFSQLKKKVPDFGPIRHFEQSPHNYEPIGLKVREAMKSQGEKEPRKSKVVNQRLAEQLAKRQKEQESKAFVQKQKKIFQNAVTDQPTLNWPDFMDLQDFVNPILHLELLLASQQEAQQETGARNHHFDETLEFNKSDEQILHMFEAYFEDMVTCFNDFNRPEFCKIQEYGQKKYEVEMKELEASRKVNLDYQRENKRAANMKTTSNPELQEAVKRGLFKFKNSNIINPKVLNFDRMLYNRDFEASYSYERYMGRIKVKEAPSDVISKGLIDHESPADIVFQKDIVLRRMNVASTQEEFFKQHRREIIKVLREHLHELKRVRELFDQFKPIYKNEMQERVRAFINRQENSLDLMEQFSDFLNELRRFRCLARELPERVGFPLFEVGTSLVKEEIQSRIDKYIISILWKFECDLKDCAKQICERFEEIALHYDKVLETAEDVIEMENFKNNLQLDMQVLQRNLASTRKSLFFLVCQADYQEILMEPQSTSGDAGTQDGECVRLIDEMLAWPAKLNAHCELADERHLQERAVVENQVFKKKKNFDQKVENLKKKLNEVHNWRNLGEYKHIMPTVQNFHTKVDKLERLKQEIAQEQSLLHGFKDDFSQLHNVVRFFEPYYELWTRIDDIMTKKKNWENSRLAAIDPDEVSQTIKESIRSLQKLQKDFGNQVSVQNILKSLQREIKELDSWRPTVDALCNRALAPRHWSKIKEVSGMSAEDVNFEIATLYQVLELKVHDVLPKLAEISENAKKESRLEDMLKSMKREWETIRFEITTFRDTHIPILTGNKVEEMQNKLDEDVLISQTIKNSPAVLPLLEEARTWERTMLFTQETIEIWLRVQSNYLYLWPIFNSVGIQDEVKSLLDSDGFATVDRAWRKIMDELKNDTLALSLHKIDNLDNILKECNFQLENIQKNLNEYLEAKRNFFSRFFFLSNEDLIEILGDSQKPRSIQKHLKKCFDGIYKVTFRAVNTQRQLEEQGIREEEITHIVSKEGEKVELIRSIQPFQYDGKVEEWLYDLEQSMKDSIKRVITEGLRDYPQVPIEEAADHLSQSTSHLYNERIRWLRSWPSQVILTVSMIVWTQQVETKLGEPAMLKKLFLQSQAQLNQVVNMVREKMPDLLRLTLSSLIVQNVHSRDLIENLARKRVQNLDDFEWICQMRYYYIQEDSSVDVKMITTVLKYCNEFLRNEGRLVITSLTDQCYRTLMSALQLNLGGAPEGPAGTGKTETTKDLAKAIGVYCIVFNCADGLNSKAMAKFFKGLASGGTWSCFDEFNRIELEVLSVIAQQILEIQRAKNQGLNKFMFEGAMIKLKPTAHIFITMNPGYAGRSVLPDNLKALFRPVAMMVPEYVSIAEISLYSYGFFESRSLAKKIVQTYRLCSEQLSTQYHYDYGMRAVKSVLTAAKNLKYEATRKASRMQSKVGVSRDESSMMEGSSASGAGYNISRMSLEDSEDLLILKSIIDVNLPKFLADDIPLFEGIINDLFPDVELPPPSYADLQKCAKKIINKNNLQVKEKFMQKIIQLYDMIKCRHGLMIVGPAGSGKTTTYRVLADTITLVSSVAPSFEEKEVETYVINPKSITLPQLYGNYDAISQEFTDGVLGSIFRFCSYVKPNQKRRWIIFDGPVDANWIENMNTVLDDNKRLCLMNSEIIQMTDSMNMIFETHDLSKASPATISRCGMVYMAEDSYGGPMTLLKSWLSLFEQKANLATLTVVTPDYLPKRMANLFNLIFLELSYKVKRQCNFIMPVSNNQITASMLRIMSTLTQQDSFVERIHEPTVKPDEITQRFDMIFQYALMWSIGAVVDDESQKTFFMRMREKIAEVFKVEGKQFRIERTFQVPDQGQPPTNFYVDGMLWISYRDQLNRQDRQVVDDDRQHEIIVPTTEIIKQKNLLGMFMGAGKPLLFVGSTGTGKTVAVVQFIRELNREKFDSLTICFSAKSSANFTQKQIEEKLEKKKRRHLGPANNKKMIVFVDDMNMPAVEQQGAQPPIELLRQWMDHKQWYDYQDKGNQLQKITDIVFVGAMCPPAGGKNPVSPRFTRHFNVVTCVNFDKQVMQRIFTKIIDVHIRREGIMGTDTARTLKQVIDASIHVFMFAQENLRPTPAKSHYLFNLRDISRVVSGIQMMRSFEHGSKAKMVRLWVHEIGRVFSDRLNDDGDVYKLYDQLQLSCRDYIKEDIYTCLKPVVPEAWLVEDPNYERNPAMMTQLVKFTDLLDGTKSAIGRGYDELLHESMPDLTKALNESLDQYNVVSQRPMELVLFNYAVIHLLRICRILKMHKGNALLIGVGGSGRQSLSYLAAFLMDQVILQPEQSKSYGYENWAEDMKKLLYMTGCDLKRSTFLLTDNQLKHSFMLEDVNNLINQYEIPGLFGPDDKILMNEKVRINAKKEGNFQLYNNGTPEQILDFLVEKVQQNLHIILAMSPTGHTLGERIRNFPSLVNCCTLDWFHKWPVEALNAVAMKMMEETPFDDELKQSIVKATEIFHLESQELSKQFLSETGRQNYVTPTSFLDLIQVFQSLLDKQRNLLYDKKMNYVSGIQKLMQQHEEIIVMQQDINEKQPKLQEFKVTAEILMQELKETAENEVEPQKRQIQQEEEKANEVAMHAEEIKIDCQNNLDKAMPIKRQAEEALNTIKPSHINEIKVLNYPPPHVRMVLHAVCVMCGRQVERTPKKENPKVLEDNWWNTAQKFMNEKDFFQQLKNYDKDNINPMIIHKIKQEFLNDPQFKPTRVAQASFAAKGLCEWIIRLQQYDKIVQEIKPKRIALDNAQIQYKSKMHELAAKQEELKTVEMRYQALQQNLRKQQEKQEELQKEIHECHIKLERAKTLLAGLGGEKERWLISLEEIEQKLKTIVPDVLLSAAMIAYLGPFTSSYRKQAVESWLFQMHTDSLITLNNFTLERVLGEPVQIRRWQMSGLPVDSFSCENGLMMNAGLKWPLMIDPQGQANRWIKNMEMSDSNQSGSRLMILKPADQENFVQRFEQALRMGLPMLLESVGEELDPILDPVLLKHVFKVAGVKQIKFGDTNIDYADEFKLYMTSRYANPHYLPELTTKVQLINFMITFEGLSEQLLNHVVRKENMQLDEEHEKLILTQYENHRRMRDTEATILKVLKDAKGDILEDENAINILNSSQQLSEEITKKQQEAEETERRLNQARQAYKPIADHSAMLFFLVSKLHLVEVMYQYSLSWFIQLFSQSVDKSRVAEESKRVDSDGADSQNNTGLKSARSSIGQNKRSDSHRFNSGGGQVISYQLDRNLSIEQQGLKTRVCSLINFFTLNLYSNVCRSIFEKDKLLFSFLLTAKIRESQGKLNGVQYQMLIKTMTGLDNPLGFSNVCKEWLPNAVWNKLCVYADQDQFFSPLIKNFQKNEEGWRRLFECEILTDDLYPQNEQNITGHWSPFMKLLILKAMRPDKLGQAVQQFVHQEMGQEFLTPPIFDIEKSFLDSSPGTPLIFILPGTDPLQQLNSFAMHKKKYETMRSISLGQNQGPIAEKVISEARKQGTWVLLQNCHLYPSWMPRLEQICEQLEMRSQTRQGDNTHAAFRLWLTSYPSEVFPATVLQSGIKMTNEPPIGLKSNMLGSYKTEPLSDPSFFSSNSKSAYFKKIAFGMTMFHAILLQRCNYGPLGWNQNHQFTVSDLQISMRQLYYFVDCYRKVPFSALKYLIGQCNYGGRVTESADQRVLMALLEDFLSEKVLEPDYCYCEDEVIGKLYRFPQGDDGYHVHIEKIKEMPNEEMPQIFGFHPNADISKNMQQAKTLTDTLLQIGDVDGANRDMLEEGEGEDEDAPNSNRRLNKVKTIMTRAKDEQKRPEDEMMSAIINDITLILPNKLVDMDEVTVLFPVVRENSMNTVLTHELMRFNRLLSKILTTLDDLRAAQRGQILMTEQLLTTRVQLIQGFVPDSWLEVSYPTMKPLASYVRDLALRIKTLRHWVNEQKPPEVFWLSGFFFTQSFLTAILQNYARKYQIEIDALVFDYKFINQEDPTDHENEVFGMHTAQGRGLVIDEVPQDGALISGLYFEGCRWDYENMCLAEQHSKQLYSKVPIIWLRPKEVRASAVASIRTKTTSPQPKDNQTASISTKRAATSHGKTVVSGPGGIPRHSGRVQGATVARKADTTESLDPFPPKLMDGKSMDKDRETGTIDAFSGAEQNAQEFSEHEAEAHYKCPLYRTQARYGTLLTTGHSTNFIGMVNTPMPKEISGDMGDSVSQKTRTTIERTQCNHWIKRGAAMICSLSH